MASLVCGELRKFCDAGGLGAPRKPRGSGGGGGGGGVVVVEPFDSVAAVDLGFVFTPVTYNWPVTASKVVLT